MAEWNESVGRGVRLQVGVCGHRTPGSRLRWMDDTPSGVQNPAYRVDRSLLP
jgi:hypothetical protein